jgi:isocitrate dehydrogenase
MYWAQALAEQNENADLKAKFTVAAKQLAENETIILKEIAETVGKPADIGGYYLPDDKKANNALRPSKTLNKIIDSI